MFMFWELSGVGVVIIQGLSVSPAPLNLRHMALTWPSRGPQIRSHVGLPAFGAIELHCLRGGPKSTARQTASEKHENRSL